MKPVLILGSGHNALVTAYYLAKAGLKPLVLEGREVIGGACVTEEFHPGFRCSTLAGSTGPLLPQIVNDLQLQKHGVEFIKPAVQICALNLEGPAISIYQDAGRTSEELASVAPRDAAKYLEFVATFERIGRALRPLLTLTPPNIDAPSKSELWNLGKLGWAVRGLGKKDEYRLLRYGPMAVADLAGEWFENESMRAIVAARGIFGAFAGPWSAGTCGQVLLQAANDGSAIAPAAFVKGGMGALTKALAKAATEAGAEIRTNAEVARIEVADGRVSKVVLSSGEELPAWICVSSHDPGITFLEFMDLGELEPGFRNKIQNYRAVGTVAKVHLALTALPKFLSASGENLSGRIHIGPEIDYLERAFDAAKYGEFSTQPYMDITIPTLTDSSLAPNGAHVMSIHAQFAPYELRSAGVLPAGAPEARVPNNWDSRREELGDVIVDALSAYAPNLKELVVGRQVLTPLDLERTYGLSGGHIHHGEMSLDQLFTFRPLIGYARYRTPIAGLYLCGSGTHPGGGVTGAPGFNASREILKDLKAGKR
ncbi:MAG TPA: NAD(P)/FAD-dependent oxidoreductase [Pyrinomonadaceae bacterium]|nr:NAD(P)/FAD-dependent oxidoreductase [Pyrinomonadaceae bacterium]